MLNKLFVILMSLFFVGCSFTAYKKTAGKAIEKFYNLGEIRYAKTGDKMFLIAYGKVYPVFQTKEAYLSDNAKYPSILGGDSWIAWFDVKNDCILLKKSNTFTPYGMFYYDMGLRLEDCHRLKENPWVVVYISGPSINEVGAAKCKTQHKLWKKNKRDIFQLKEEEYFSGEDSFRSELLYTGKEKETIFLLYREFTTKGLAREPFYQQLRYNVKQSSIINFKTLKIQVIEATNEGISFKILSDGGVPWMKTD